jgi:hypothetical protein
VTCSSVAMPWGSTRKFRNVQGNRQVALVVDELVSQDPWTARGLEIHETADAVEDVDPPVPFMSREVIRITPTWVASWGIDPEAPGRPRGHSAVVRSESVMPHRESLPEHTKSGIHPLRTGAPQRLRRNVHPSSVSAACRRSLACSTPSGRVFS